MTNVAETDLWIVDPKTGQPKPPVKQPGYYPGYSTLSQKSFWDATTREEVLKRLGKVPEIRFFSEYELPVITAVCDRVIPQDDRLPEFRIPIVNHIDEKLFENRLDGYRYADMPPDQDAYRLGIKAIDETAIAIHGARFVELYPLSQDDVLKSIHDNKHLAALQIWKQLPMHHFWMLLLTDCAAAYYSHPWAWDEIGYGGPAYPRAYMRLEGGMPEPWEVDEQRYEWSAPANSRSDVYEPEEMRGGMSHPGQGGTH